MFDFETVLKIVSENENFIQTENSRIQVTRGSQKYSNLTSEVCILVIPSIFLQM